VLKYKGKFARETKLADEKGKVYEEKPSFGRNR
jgi:hypothetical protein